MMIIMNEHTKYNKWQENWRLTRKTTMTTINSKSILITRVHKHITFTKKQPTLPVSLSSSHLRSDLSHARIHCPLGSIKNLRPILSAQKTGWNLQGKLRWNLGPKVCAFFFQRRIPKRMWTFEFEGQTKKVCKIQQKTLAFVSADP